MSVYTRPTKQIIQTHQLINPLSPLRLPESKYLATQNKLINETRKCYIVVKLYYDDH